MFHRQWRVSLGVGALVFYVRTEESKANGPADRRRSLLPLICIIQNRTREQLGNSFDEHVGQDISGAHIRHEHLLHGVFVHGIHDANVMENQS